MKKITFVLLLTVSVVPASHLFAQQPMYQQAPANGGMLRVKLADGTPISIGLDGRYFRNRGRALTVGDLPEGEHYLKIYTHTPDRGGRSGQLMFEGKVSITQGQMTVFVLNAYSGETNITERNINPNAYGRPGYEDYAYGDGGDHVGNGYMGQPNTPQGGYDNNGGNYNQNTPPQNGYNDNQGNNAPPPPNGYNDNQGNYNQPPNGYNDQGNNPPPQNSYNDNQGNTPPPNYNGNGNYRYNGNYNDGDNGGNNNAPVAQPDVVTTVDQPFLDNLKVKTDAKITDTNKLKLLKDSLAKQTISTEQVNTIMGWLNFENSRVNFAKWAYSITVDKQGYESLGNQFTFQSSRTELDNYINNNR